MPFAEKYVNEATQILETLARSRETPIFYSELARKIGVSAISAGAVLRRVSKRSYDANGRLLGVLVVTKKTGLPSDSFFEQAKELYVMRDDELPQIFFRTELNRVYGAHKTS